MSFPTGEERTRSNERKIYIEREKERETGNGNKVCRRKSRQKKRKRECECCVLYVREGGGVSEREGEGVGGRETDRERTSHERVVGGRWTMIKDKREGRSANGVKDFIHPSTTRAIRIGFSRSVLYIVVPRRLDST